jgi:hypothetical protein
MATAFGDKERSAEGGIHTITSETLKKLRGVAIQNKKKEEF